MNEAAQRRLQRILTLILGTAAIGLLAWISTQQVWHADWTAAKRNSLTAASIAVLESMPEPITFSAWVFPNAELQTEIKARAAPYLRARDDISLNFFDPALHPEQARELGIGASGELLIEYQGRREKIRIIDESAISTALQRLAFAGKATIRILAGHGERDPSDKAQAGWSKFAQTLSDKGLHLEPFNFAEQARVPEQTDVLVLAAPQRPLLDAEIDRIIEYVNQGGNLLWLFEPDSDPLPALASSLSLKPLYGTVVYQDFKLLGTGHPALALVADYSAHEITKNFEDLTLYPLAAGIELTPGSPWFGHRLMSSPKRSWLETGALDESLVFEVGHDTRGPIILGAALSRIRTAAHSDQRVIVIGDSDFLSNAYVEQLGNRQLGINLMQWLAGRDSQLDIDVPRAPDLSLSLSPLQTTLIAGFFVVMLPLLLLSAGMVRWWTRRPRPR